MFIRMLIVALVLGLGWAIRGHFGHEWGASWAGAMGALAVLAVSNRKDWMQNAGILTLLGAVGWAVGGMMSYGIVIGYCRGTDFVNVAYGYAMLAIIGGLYGLIGGGLLGLGLESTDKKKPDWARLLAEMFAGGFLFWGFFIYQLEWFMTPPRSELWAGCMGAALAMIWFMQRNGFKSALRVGLYSALGAGFGFSFGNFIQGIGSVSGIAYNWWNVMEFTLGFCGGLGMTYAIATSRWQQHVTPSKSGNRLAILVVFFAIPFINFISQFEDEKLSRLAESLTITNINQFIFFQDLMGWIIMALFTLGAILIWKGIENQDVSKSKLMVPFLLYANSLYYIIFGYIIKGIFYKTPSLKYSDTLYVPILLLAFALWFFNRNKEMKAVEGDLKQESWKHWALLISGLLVVIVIITLISINIQQSLGGSHIRFK